MIVSYLVYHHMLVLLVRLQKSGSCIDDVD